MKTPDQLKARVRTLRWEAEGVVSVELVSESGIHFPRFTAGAHVDVYLANGMIRSYSLSNSPEEPDRYVLGVLEEPSGRGGSKYIHSNFRCGMLIFIGSPRNRFPLNEDASSSVLIAGGIGITPILSMYRRLLHLNKHARLVYCARSRSNAGFIEEIHRLGGNVEMYFDDEHENAPINLMKVMEGEGRGVHAYCCGPRPVLSAFQDTCANAGIDNVHIEGFTADPDAVFAAGQRYIVELVRRGRTITVEPGNSLLRSLLNAGVHVEYSCEAGVCGSCETQVIAGNPDHRDNVLTVQEKLANKKIMICVSGCLGEKLVLDL
jgi:ferredoxin-NADP reductase